MEILEELQIFLEARSEYDLLIEDFLRNQFSFSASTRANDPYEAICVSIIFSIMFLDQE